MTRPLILDVDGTLLKSDLTHEMILAAVMRDPGKALHYARVGTHDKPQMKQEMIARIGDRLDTDVAPLEPKIVALAEQAVADGREVHLCSGSEQSLVDRLGARLDFITECFGTSPTYNMTSKNKASFLSERFPDGFDYAGNSTQDFKVWEAAHSAYGMRPPRGTKQTRTAAGKAVTILEERKSELGTLLKAMRPWRLWFPLPLLILVCAAYYKGVATNLWLPVWATVVWMLTVAALALIDDLRDIHQDRRDEKPNRPIAAGELSVTKAVAGLVALVFVAAVLSLAILPFWMFPVFALVLWLGSKLTALPFGIARSMLTRLTIIIASVTYIPLALI
ncbi:MAG: UbiA family prenyltransferase [Litorimonas sp.]